jgi:hypothetical protein
MWRMIDNELISEGLKIGQIISDKSTEEDNFKILEIRKNEIVTAAKTDVMNFMVIFPQQDLVDASRWVMDSDIGSEI